MLALDSVGIGMELVRLPLPKQVTAIYLYLTVGSAALQSHLTALYGVESSFCLTQKNTMNEQ